MGPLPPTVIVGNKTDLRERADGKEKVTTEEGIKFTEYFKEKLGVPAVFKETSALSGYNVENTFHELLTMMDNVQNDESDLFIG